MNDPLHQSLPEAPLSVAFEAPHPGLGDAPDVLALIGFAGTRCTGAAMIPTPLAGLDGRDQVEVWRSRGPLQRGAEGVVAYSQSDDYLFGRMELVEAEFGDCRAVTEAAYQQLLAFQQRSAKPHLLRLWHYFSEITAGVGDGQRYRQFCVGRVQALSAYPALSLPAATAIGRSDGVSTLVMYWLAGRQPGVGIENPRQLSARSYPRQYGPVAPRFTRATLTAAGQLLISGTASIVGHASHHHGRVRDQLAETLTNIEALLREANRLDPRVPAELGDGSRLKVYLRHRADLPVVQNFLSAALPSGCRCLFLEGEICRDDLLVEIEGVHGEPGPAAIG